MEPNTVCSQSLSDVTPILNGISTTDCASPFGSGAQYCRSKRSPLSTLDIPFHIKDTNTREGQELRVLHDEEVRCIEIGHEMMASLVFISSWVCRLMSRRRNVDVPRSCSGLHQSKNHSVPHVTRNCPSKKKDAYSSP